MHLHLKGAKQLRVVVIYKMMQWMNKYKSYLDTLMPLLGATIALVNPKPVSHA